MSDMSNPLSAQAQAIVTAHHADLALPITAQAPVTYSSKDPIYRAAKQACLAMGFVEIDAECLGLAWQIMTQRSAQFEPGAWPHEPADFGLNSWPRDNAFAPCPNALGLYAVLPDAQWIGRMARAGVPTVQLRFKSNDAQAIALEVTAAVEAVRGTPALLFINDHWQAAIAAGAYGVHLGQEDMDVADLHAIRAAGLRLGLSSHGYAEMVRADSVGPSYIAMGAVFPTTLKRMVTAAQGTGRLNAYARLMQRYPLVAIGGIDEARMGLVLRSGVGSVAVVRAITGAPNPEQAAAQLMAQIQAQTPTHFQSNATQPRASSSADT